MEVHFDPPSRWDRYLYRLWRMYPDRAILQRKWTEVHSPGHAEDILDDFDGVMEYDWYVTWLIVKENCAPGRYMLMR